MVLNPLRVATNIENGQNQNGHQIQNKYLQTGEVIRVCNWSNNWYKALEIEPRLVLI